MRCLSADYIKITIQTKSTIKIMNILFLSHYFPPEVNAPATRTYEHCKRWVARGHKVTVVTCAPNCPSGVVYEGYKNSLRTVEQIDGVTVIRVATWLAPNKGFIKRILNYVSYMVNAVVQSVFMRKVDVVVATSPQFFCGWAGVLLHWLRRWPFILEIRDIWPESIVTVGAMKKSRVITFLEKLEMIMYHAADHIVTVGDGYKNNISKKGITPGKLSVVINGVDLTRFKQVDNTTAVKKQYHSENRFICSYIGTVGMAHGLEVMLDAAEQYQKKGRDDIMLWIVGDGAHREKLESDATRRGLTNTVFTGRLPKEEMPAIIAASDACLVHLNGTELFGSVIPSKIFELMAMDVPIIMGVRGQALEFVLEAGAGVAMEPDSVTSLMDGIETVRTQGKTAFSGRAYVAEHFNRDSLADRMLDIVKNVVGKE